MSSVTKLAHPFVSPQTYVRVDKYLLRELDDRPVGAAGLPARARLIAQT